MAVFRNVMAFLGLDDDDQMYDDEAYYDEEEERSPRARNKTIALDDRLGDDQPSFGFSADSEMNEMGGVGAVRPLRPVHADNTAPVPEALTGIAGVATTASAVSRRSPDPRPAAGAFEAPVAERPQTGGRDTQGTETTTVANRSSFEEPAPSAVEASVKPNDGVSRSKSGPSTEEPQSLVVTHAKPRLHIPSSFEDASRIADDFRSGAPVVMNLTKVEKPVARRLVDFASGVCYVLAGGMERVAANVYLLTPAGVDVSAEDRRRMQERGFER